MKPNSIIVVGLGKVGDAFFKVLANSSHYVVGVDVDKARIREVENWIGEQRPSFNCSTRSITNSEALGAADVYLVCVDTVSSAGSIDLSNLHAAIESVASGLKENGSLVLVVSTCPVGTLREVSDAIQKLRPDLKAPGAATGAGDFYLATSPERSALEHFIGENIEFPRYVGGLSTECGERASEFLIEVLGCKVERASPEICEFTKLAENVFRDANIALATEIARIAGENGLDFERIRNLANSHSRVDIHVAGIGVGGDCIPFATPMLLQGGSTSTLLQRCREVNEDTPYRVARSIIVGLRRTESKSLGLLGLTFKPDSRDFGNSPALLIAKEISKFYGDVLVADDHLLDAGQDCSPGYVSEQRLFDECDFIAILTQHQRYGPYLRGQGPLGWQLTCPVGSVPCLLKIKSSSGPMDNFSGMDWC